MDAGIIKDLIGKPFIDGGRGPDAYDCWGVCIEALSRIGYQLPDYPISAMDKVSISAAIQVEKQAWQEIADPQSGCVVVMRLGSHTLINHCGVYIGQGRMIHIRDKTGVVIERIESPVMKRIIKGFYLPPAKFYRSDIPTASEI